MKNSLKLRPSAWILGAIVVTIGSLSLASNHREAPITALDHKADITDLFAFVSYDQNTTSSSLPEKVTMVLCVDPLLEPGNGPTLFPFDPDIRYEINIDNNHDARADVTLRFRFNTSYGLPDVFTAALGVGANGAATPGTTSVVVPPRITSFSSPGLNQLQTYSVEMIRPNGRRMLSNQVANPLYAVPCNVGPRTMDYPALFNQGSYSLGGGISVFAGTVDDPFFIDLGAAFDTINFRTLGSGIPGVLTAAEDSASQNFASDTVSGFGVNAIAIEVPIAMLTSTGVVEPATAPEATLGIWATTSRRRVTIRRAPHPSLNSGSWRQVQRIGNPLVNELLIGIGSKDRFSMEQPMNDAQFAQFVLDPVIAKAAEALYGGALSIPAAPRMDLLPLVTYSAPIAAPGTPAGPVADLLRLNTGIPPTPVGSASRLGALGGDMAGFPNGRRLFDDVVDITLRVVVGGVLDPQFMGTSPNMNLGDGVNVNDASLRTSFPYLADCPSGRNRRHIDPGEPGGGPIQ